MGTIKKSYKPKSYNIERLKNYLNKKSITKNIPMVVGGQGINQVKSPELFEVFDQITTNPCEALELIKEPSYNLNA